MLASTAKIIRTWNENQNGRHQDVPRVVGERGESNWVLPSLQGESTELLNVSETDLCMTIELRQIIIPVNLEESLLSGISSLWISVVSWCSAFPLLSAASVSAAKTSGSSSSTSEG